nr:immunoglobulin light chain junction region [Macaca mulatta]MOW35994.1 immunoglobulin light chain junction region [Macaca mulatta]MOW36028.1 immunoglobulin light chain junction region [Macaca mulatta]MOW36031.1 immunoglobulin light chain junction region [Macaca mulatta]MOW36037.1 immunoglobulin light chain junction region [Macaca mulatta]
DYYCQVWDRSSYHWVF